MFDSEPDVEKNVRNLGFYPLERRAEHCLFRVLLQQHRNVRVNIFETKHAIDKRLKFRFSFFPQRPPDRNCAALLHV